MQDPTDPPSIESNAPPDPLPDNRIASAEVGPDRFDDPREASRPEPTLELPTHIPYDPPPPEFSPNQLPPVLNSPPPVLAPPVLAPVKAVNPMDFANLPPAWNAYPEYAPPVKKKREPIRWEEFKEPVTLPATDMNILGLAFWGLGLIAFGIITEAMWEPLVPIEYKPHVAIVGTGLALAMAGLEPYLRFLWRWVYVATFALMVFWMFSESLGYLVVLGFAGVTHLVRAVVRIYQRTQE